MAAGTSRVSVRRITPGRARFVHSGRMSPTNVTQAPEIAERLRELYVERALAEHVGLTANRRYMDDIEDEISG